MNTVWTEERDAWLRKGFRDMDTRKLVREFTWRFGIWMSYDALKKRASRLGLRKSARYMKSLGR